MIPVRVIKITHDFWENICLEKTYFEKTYFEKTYFEKTSSSSKKSTINQVEFEYSCELSHADGSSMKRRKGRIEVENRTGEDTKKIPNRIRTSRRPCNYDHKPRALPIEPQWYFVLWACPNVYLILPGAAETWKRTPLKASYHGNDTPLPGKNNWVSTNHSL